MLEIKDKNGKKLRLGDILLLPKRYNICHVIFNSQVAAYGITNQNEEGFFSFERLLEETYDDFISKEVEIIGNIYDDFSTNHSKLRELRLSYNISQYKFADIFDIHQHQVSDWERGKIPLSDEKLQRFIDVLKRKYENEDKKT